MSRLTKSASYVLALIMAPIEVLLPWWNWLEFVLYLVQFIAYAVVTRKWWRKPNKISRS